jgi:hypothetical protein
MSITPRAIQEILEELETSKQSRLRAWEALQKIRATISDLGAVAIGPPKRKTFEDEGALLDKTLTKALRGRNEALKSLVKAAHRFKDATLIKDKKTDSECAQGATERAGSG